MKYSITVQYANQEKEFIVDFPDEFFPSEEGRAILGNKKFEEIIHSNIVDDFHSTFNLEIAKVSPNRHGGPYDRGAADSYYRRGRHPHYYRGGTYLSERIEEKDMTPEEIAAYNRGYFQNEKDRDFKDYGYNIGPEPGSELEEESEKED